MLVIVNLALVSTLVNAATLQGTVYDLSLNPVDKSIVEVNSVPQQRVVTGKGEYSFNLAKGSYIIRAKSNGYNADENITIIDEGTYNLDLFLFPDLDEDITKDVNIEVITDKTDYKPYLFFGILIFILALGILVYKLSSKFAKKTEEKKDIAEEKYAAEGFIDDKAKVIDIIKKHGNRTTQKDIRKEMPLSEAKVSLIIAELEHENKIKKIKKGRGNIIILDEQSNKGNWDIKEEF